MNLFVNIMEVYLVGVYSVVIRHFEEQQVNWKVCILILAIALLSCNSGTEKVVDNPPPKAVGNTVKLTELKKLFVVGDFDGNGENDTIFQHNYSRRTRTEINNSADPFQNEWDIVVKWFYAQNADVYLRINKNNRDTLHLGIAQGLYCLINIGDSNSDGRDEIAFVVDYCDFSDINSCKIYSFCNEKWILLKQFGIYEDSFNFATDKAPTFNNIRNYLEKQNNDWVYMDYAKDEVGEMKILHIEKKCE